jgi:NAD(P)-dependent dehydrogenase (short-subunit alcohol dehydrogenase family)
MEVDKMAERAIAAFGQVQFLFKSAGAAIRGAKFIEIDDTLMEKTFALRLPKTPNFFAEKTIVITGAGSGRSVW